jgi:hypothetical protein
VVFAVVVLESEGKRNKPRIAVRQPQQSRSEPIVGIRHICLFQYCKPILRETHELVVRLRGQFLEIYILLPCFVRKAK